MPGPFFTGETELEAKRRSRERLRKLGFPVVPWEGDRVEPEEPEEPEFQQVTPEPVEESVLSGTAPVLSSPITTPEPKPVKPPEPPKYVHERALPEDEDKILLQRQEEHLAGLNKAGHTTNPEGGGGDLTLDSFYSRMENFLEGRAPKRAVAPGEGSSPSIWPGKKIIELSGWVAPPFRELYDAESMYRPATSLPYYGQRRGFGRVAAWAVDREGFTGVREGEEQEKRPPELEGEDPASARELLREAESKITETGEKVAFADFEPLAITPGAIKILRLSLERLGIPEEQARSIPLEYVAPVWHKIRTQLAQGQQALKERKPIPTEKIKGTARVIGDDEVKDLTAEIPIEGAEEAPQQIVAGAATARTAKEALQKAGITEGYFDLFEEPLIGKDIGDYDSLARFYKLSALEEKSDAVKKTKADINVPLVHVKNKGWNIDLNSALTNLRQRKYIQLRNGALRQMEREGLTPKAAYESYMKNPELRDELGEKAIRHAHMRVMSFLGSRGRGFTPAYYTEKSIEKHYSEMFSSDAPAPATPMTPILRQAQMNKFMGPWRTLGGLTVGGPAAAGRIYEEVTPQNISHGQLFEFLRTVPSTVAGSWITTWDPPDSSNPQVIWESLWDHWGSPEHYEMMTTGQWDLTERFYDVGDTTADLLGITKAGDVLGGSIESTIDSYKFRKALGLGIGLPILLVADLGPLDAAFGVVGKVASPISRGLKIGRNQHVISRLEEVVSSDKSTKDKLIAFREAFGWSAAHAEAAEKIIEQQVGAQLGKNTSEVVSRLGKEIKKAETKHTRTQVATKKALETGNKAKVNEAKLTELKASQEVLDTKYDAALQMKALADEEVRVSGSLLDSVGNPKRSLKKYSDIQELHQLKQKEFEELLEQKIFPEGEKTKVELYKIEKAYLDQRREAVREIEGLLLKEEVLTGKTLQKTVGEVELRTRRGELDKQIERLTRAVARLDEMTGLTDEATELQTQLTKAETRLKDDLTATPEKVKHLKTKGTPQEKWDRYLSQYSSNRVAKRIRDTRAEIKELGKQIKAEAKKAGKKADRQIDLEKARGTLEKLKVERTQVEQKLLTAMEKRFRKTPAFVDETIEGVTEEVIEQTPLERALGATSKEKKDIEIQVRALLKDDEYVFRGYVSRGRSKVKVVIREDGILVPVYFDKLLGKPAKYHRYEANKSGIEWRALTEDEMSRLVLPSPGAAVKTQRTPAFTRLLKNYLGEIKAAKKVRQDALASLGVSPSDPILKKIMKAAENVDVGTLELLRLRRYAESKLAKEKQQLAAKMVKAAQQEQKKGLKQAEKLGLKTPSDVQAKIIAAKKAEIAAREALTSLRNLWDDSARSYIKGLKYHNALLRRGGRLNANTFTKLLTEVPRVMQAKIARLIGKGVPPLEAAEAVIEDIPKYIQVELPGLSSRSSLKIERITEKTPAWSEGAVEGVGGMGVVEGSIDVRPKAIRETLNERYGKRIVDRFLAQNKEAWENLGKLPDDDIGLRSVGDRTQVNKILSSTEEVLSLTPGDLIGIQDFEELLAVAANKFWQQDRRLDLIAQSLRIQRERGNLDNMGIAAVTSFVSRLFRGGAVNTKEMSDQLRQTVAAAENLSTRAYEEVDSLLKKAFREDLTSDEILDLFTRYMDGESFLIGTKLTKMGETFMNSGVNLWDAVRVNLRNNARWTVRVGKGEISMGRLGQEIKIKAEKVLEKKGVTQMSVRAEVLGNLPPTPELERQAALKWAQILSKQFRKEMNKVEGLKPTKSRNASGEMETRLATVWGEGKVDAPKSLRTLSVALWPRGKQMTQTGELLRSAYVALNSAPDFPTFMRLLGLRLREAPFDLKIAKEDPVRGYHIAVLASLQAKIESQAISRAARIVGPTLSKKEADAMNAMVTGNWGSTKEGLEAFDRALGILNDLGLPINRQTTKGLLNKAAKQSLTIQRVSEDPFGMNAYLPTDLIEDFENVMGSIQKEIEGSYDKSIRQDLEGTVRRALPSALYINELGAWTVSMLLNLVKLWRQSVVTGLFLANPRHWTSTSVSNFFQVHQEEGIKTASKVSFQNLPVNIPFVGRGFQDYIALKAASGNESGSVVAAVFNPRLQEFWTIGSRKASSTFYRDARGRLHNLQELRIRAAEDGILSTFEAERGLLQQADINALKGKEKLHKKAGRKIGAWNAAIAQMMVYGEQRVRTGLWLEKIINQGASYREAQQAVFNTYYDWKHGISDIEREFFVHLATFWRWFSLAARRHGSAITKQLAEPVPMSKILTGRTPLGRARRQLQVIRSLDEFSEWEDDNEANIDTASKEWDALMAEIRPWWGFERLVFGQRPMPLDHSLQLEDISGRFYTHWTYIGPAITSAEMFTHQLSIATGISIFIAQLINFTRRLGGKEPSYVIPAGKFGGPATAGFEAIFQPVIEMLLPWFEAFAEQQLGGYRNSFKHRPLSLGEAAIVEQVGKEYLNLGGADLEIHQNRFTGNADAIQLYRLLPFFGSQVPSIIGNIVSAQPDMEDDMARGMAVMLGNFLGIRKVPFAPENQLKWEMRGIETKLKEIEDSAKLPMERTRHSDVWKK